MLNFIRENAGNILIIAILVGLTAWILVSYFKNKARGKAACISCAGCPHSSTCASRSASASGVARASEGQIK